MWDVTAKASSLTPKDCTGKRGAVEHKLVRKFINLRPLLPSRSHSVVYWLYRLTGVNETFLGILQSDC